MRFLVTVRWRRRANAKLESYQCVVKSVRGDSLRLVLDTDEGLEVHFLLEVIEAVQMERKG